MNLHVVFPGHAQHERAQGLGQHVHAVELKLYDLLLEQILPALLRGTGIAQRRLAGVVADAQRVGAKFEIAENIAAGGVVAAAAGLAHAAVDLADDVGMRHAGVLENHFAVLIETPAALIEHLADAEPRRIPRHQKQSGALLKRNRRIGARVDEEQLAYRRIGDETLLAVEDPLVAFALGAKLQPGLRIVGRRQTVVGAGARFGYSLAEQKRVVCDKWPEEPRLLLVGAGRADQMAPFPVLTESLGYGAVGPRQFRHDQGL